MKTSLFFIFILLVFGCKKDEKDILLSRSEKNRIKSEIRKKRKPIKAELDSIYKAQMPEMVASMVDSIMKIRLKERKEKLGY